MVRNPLEVASEHLDVFFHAVLGVLAAVAVRQLLMWIKGKSPDRDDSVT